MSNGVLNISQVLTHFINSMGKATITIPILQIRKPSSQEGYFPTQGHMID